MINFLKSCDLVNIIYVSFLLKNRMRIAEKGTRQLRLTRLYLQLLLLILLLLLLFGSCFWQFVVSANWQHI